MRILQVITSLQTGGAEKIVVDLSLKLKARGHVVDVVAFVGGSSIFKQALVDGGCGVIEFSDSEGVYNLKHIKRLKRLMPQYDIVHTHNTSPQLFAAMAKGKFNTKLVTTEHSTNNRRRTLKGYGWIDRWMYRRYDKIVCISDIAKEKLLEHIGDKYASEVLTINNGVDVCCRRGRRASYSRCVRYGYGGWVSRGKRPRHAHTCHCAASHSIPIMAGRRWS